MILITGGAGFIGSAVVRHFISSLNCPVVVVDKLTYAGNLQSLRDVKNDPLFSFEQIDICHLSELLRIFNEYRPDTVIHLAAESHVDRSIDAPSAFIDTNMVGTYCML